MSDTPDAVPLVEQLRDVPPDADDCYPWSDVYHKNIPYGELCHSAASEIERLQRERDEAMENLRHCGAHMMQVSEELEAGDGEITLDAAVRAMGRLRRAERERNKLRQALSQIVTVPTLVPDEGAGRAVQIALNALNTESLNTEN